MKKLVPTIVFASMGLVLLTGGCGAFPKSTFKGGDGAFEVGGPSGLVAGTWSVTVPDSSKGCYWERLRDNSGKDSSVILSGHAKPGAKISVEIMPDDKIFYTEACGSWVLGTKN